MSLLSPTYDVKLNFEDWFDVLITIFRDDMFDRSKCSDQQLQSAMKLETFNEVANELAELYSNPKNDFRIRKLLERSISGYLRDKLIRPVYGCTFVRSSGYWQFEIYSEYQREWIFIMKFMLK